MTTTKTKLFASSSVHSLNLEINEHIQKMESEGYTVTSIVHQNTVREASGCYSVLVVYTKG